MSMSAPSPWSEFSHDPRRPETSGLRASDRDRDVVLRVLGEAFADGRLDRTEYDERADAVARAKTMGELPPVMADLVPAAPIAPASELREQAVEEYRRARRNALSSVLGTLVVTTLIWWAVFGGGFYWPVFFLIGTGGNALRLLTRRDEWVDDKVRELEKKQRKEIERRQRREIDGGSD